MLKKIIILVIINMMIPGCSKSEDNPIEPSSEAKTIVEHFGGLKVVGKNIVDQQGAIVELRGMSLFWSQWGGAYYNKETITWLRDDWNCTVIRAAMGIEGGGYLDNPEIEYQKVKRVIDACIELGIYVIVDWHDHHAENHITESSNFFAKISKEYGSYPNIIYEIYNEPLAVSWKDVLKPYAETVINAVRANDPDNIIIVGTPNWSQDVEDVINNRISDSNVAYSFHFYSSTHKQELRNKVIQAVNSGIPIWITEWGMSEASGNGIIDLQSLNEWAAFMESNNFSWCNWSIINKDESSAALLPGTNSLSGWNENDLTQSGKTIREYIQRMNQPIFDSIK